MLSVYRQDRNLPPLSKPDNEVLLIDHIPAEAAMESWGRHFFTPSGTQVLSAPAELREAALASLREAEGEDGLDKGKGIRLKSGAIAFEAGNTPLGVNSIFPGSTATEIDLLPESPATSSRQAERRFFLHQRSWERCLSKPSRRRV